MSGRFSGSIVVNKPIEELFDFLADGENDKLFSKRVQEIRKTTDGPIGIGTSWASTVKDGGMKSERVFRLTDYERPTRIRWTEDSKNALTVPEGGYDLEPAGEGSTRLTLFNVLEGQNIFGRLIEGFAVKQGTKSVDGMLASIKQVAESRSSGDTLG